MKVFNPNKLFSLFILTLTFLINVFPVIGQDGPSAVIRVAQDQNIARLVAENFIKQENCVEVSNIQTIGEVNSIGSFSNGAASIGMDEGIVFTTGRLGDIPGPNKGEGTSAALTGISNAPYLGRVVRNGLIFDAVGIEFDFESTASFVSFTYVFASEEYCEFVGSQFNDTFGFFVSGPGIDGDGFDSSVNIAKIPERDDFVSINNVNHSRNSGLFVNNLTRAGLENCNLDLPESNLDLIEFDGYTRRLEAFVQVIPCETYHIRLVVGDVSDNILDSGVFLESNSFGATGPVRVRADVVGSTDLTVFENCLEGKFIFSRNKFSGREDPLEVNYRLEGTAQNGIDFQTFPQNIFIPTNQFQTELPLLVIPDDIDESLENVMVVIETQLCDCVLRDTAELTIGDTKEEINAFFDDAFVCAGQEFALSPTIIDPIEPINYQWSTGDSSAFIRDNIFQPTLYSVTVSDQCGATDSLDVEVQLQPVPELALMGDFDWCEGRDPEVLEIDLPGQPPWTLNYAVNGGDFRSIENIEISPFPFPFTEPGSYEFVGFSDRFCSGIVSGDGIEVSTIPFELGYQLQPPSCPNAKDGSISLDIMGGAAPYAIRWSLSEENESVLSDLEAGGFGVTITDGQGCVLTDSIVVPAANPGARCKLDLEDSVFIPNIFSPNGDGANDLFAVNPGSSLIKELSFQIYDRWGGLAYQSQVMEFGGEVVTWDGGDYQTAVFLCVVEVRLVDDTLDYVVGDVTLVR